MLRLASTVARCNEAEEIMREIIPPLQRLIAFDVASFCLPGSGPDSFQVRVWDRGEFHMDQPELPRAATASGWVWENQVPLLIHDLDLEMRFGALGWLLARHVSCFCAVPISTHGSRVGTLGLGSSTRGAYGPAELELLQWICEILALGIENALARTLLAHERKQMDALLSIQTRLARQSDLTQALPDISRALRGVVPHDMAYLSALLPGRDLLTTHQFDPATDKLESLERPTRESLVPALLRERHLRVLHYEELCGLLEFPGVKLALENGARSACLVPLLPASGPGGILGLTSKRDNAYRRAEIGFMEHLSRPLTAALESANLNVDLRRREERFQVLAEINTVLLSHDGPTLAFPRISELIRTIFRHEYATFELRDTTNDTLARTVADFPRRHPPAAEAVVPVRGSATELILRAAKAIILDQSELESIEGDVVKSARQNGIRSLCGAPLLRPQGAYGAVVLGSSHADGFHREDLPFLEEVAARIALGLDYAKVVREIRHMKGPVAGAGKSGLWADKLAAGEIVGSSKPLLEVLDQVAIVAASDATVLVLGETGTGKDLIAKAIHTTSPRKGKPLVKVNCAAIPTGLLESELFGHEKGSFTGAIVQKVGRLETAHQGTLFLDEIGEIPLELQPKLLRALQDHEFERLGGNRTIKVDLRVIAATNRDLQKAVADGLFRADLYYRLNVFPIRVPSLRERRSDIPDLIWHFVRKYEIRFGRHIESIPEDAMRTLADWPWPGNVRELENFIERSVILTTGPELRVPVADLAREAEPPRPLHGTLEQAERDHILLVLRETSGALSGPHGAAQKLGLKRTTLQSKMQRLGILRSEYWPPR